MADGLLAVLAFLIAAAISITELVTAKYPRTFFLVVRERPLYLYGLIYGIVAAAVFVGLDALIASKQLTVQGLGLSNRAVRAILVGLTTKALMHINLWNVGTGSRSMPVGIATLVQLFEPQLLRTLELNEFNRVRLFLAPRAGAYPDLATVRTDILGNIPPTLPAEERGAFENEVTKATTVTAAMELLLRFLGRKTFDRVFPAA
jgi:hypothetical protein